MASLAQRRENARRMATTLVSIAIATAGLMLVAFAILLVVRGGLAFLFLSVLVGGLGALLALLGFFFQLVPFRLEELARGKREHDQRLREEREER